jgi:hypothetical protein
LAKLGQNKIAIGLPLDSVFDIHCLRVILGRLEAAIHAESRYKMSGANGDGTTLSGMSPARLLRSTSGGRLRRLNLSVRYSGARQRYRFAQKNAAGWLRRGESQPGIQRQVNTIASLPRPRQSVEKEPSRSLGHGVWES